MYTKNHASGGNKYTGNSINSEDGPDESPHARDVLNLSMYSSVASIEKKNKKKQVGGFNRMP